MRWRPGGMSRNVEDRRAGGGFGRAGMGIGGTVVLVVLSLLFGRNLLDDGSGGGVPTGMAPEPGDPGGGYVVSTPHEDSLVQFVSFVLDDTESTWSGLFQERGGAYQPARLVLFRDMVQSACGFAQSATGPFYCPGDSRVYIDLGFYDDLRRRFGAPGDFAQAYVLAHEIGHHVQRLLGTEAEMRAAQQRRPDAANELSVALELQADCYAGVWAHSTEERDLLEAGDVEEGMAAASAVGDDRLQQMSGTQVSPESFTHGSSAQRVRWFRRGMETGRPESCDTFSDLGR